MKYLYFSFIFAWIVNVHHTICTKKSSPTLCFKRISSNRNYILVYSVLSSIYNVIIIRGGGAHHFRMQTELNSNVIERHLISSRSHRKRVFVFKLNVCVDYMRVYSNRAQHKSKVAGFGSLVLHQRLFGCVCYAATWMYRTMRWRLLFVYGDTFSWPRSYRRQH